MGYVSSQEGIESDSMTCQVFSFQWLILMVKKGVPNCGVKLFSLSRGTLPSCPKGMTPQQDFDITWTQGVAVKIWMIIFLIKQTFNMIIRQYHKVSISWMFMDFHHFEISRPIGLAQAQPVHRALHSSWSFATLRLVDKFVVSANPSWNLRDKHQFQHPPTNRWPQQCKQSRSWWPFLRLKRHTGFTRSQGRQHGWLLLWKLPMHELWWF